MLCIITLTGNKLIASNNCIFRHHFIKNKNKIKNKKQGEFLFCLHHDQKQQIIKYNDEIGLEEYWQTRDWVYYIVYFERNLHT